MLPQNEGEKERTGKPLSIPVGQDRVIAFNTYLLGEGQRQEVETIRPTPAYPPIARSVSQSCARAIVSFLCPEANLSPGLGGALNFGLAKRCIKNHCLFVF